MTSKYNKIYLYSELGWLLSGWKDHGRLLLVMKTLCVKLSGRVRRRLTNTGRGINNEATKFFDPRWFSKKFHWYILCRINQFWKQGCSTHEKDICPICLGMKISRVRHIKPSLTVSKHTLLNIIQSPFVFYILKEKFAAKRRFSEKFCCPEKWDKLSCIFEFAGERTNTVTAYSWSI